MAPVFVMARWDGKPAGDDLGGTAQMVQLARAAAGIIDVVLLDSRGLLSQ